MKTSTGNQLNNRGNEIDWMITLVPFFLVIGLCALFFCMPEQSNNVLSKVDNV